MLQIANVIDLENVAPTMSGRGRLRCKILSRNLLAVVVFLAGCLSAAGTPFPWRGYMLDVSRHFFTVREIKRTLDGMEKCGLNVFHWHLVDGQGWRIQIDRYPRLVTTGSVRTNPVIRTNVRFADGQPGAYGPFYYTKDEVRDVVAYAKARGIRVIPEIEIPGHEAAAIRAYPGLGCKGLPNIGEFCLGDDDAIQMVEGILDEVAELFPDEVIHTGGDECSGQNWSRCEKCQARNKKLGLSANGELQGWATRHFADYLRRKGKRMAAWDSVLDFGGVPKDVIVIAYRDQSYVLKGATNGHDVVAAPYTRTYLDADQLLRDDPYEYCTAYPPVSTASLATFDPLDGVPDCARGRVLGGEACLWTEFVTDAASAEWHTWPRLAGLAEVLKSGPCADEAAFVERMDTMSSELRRMGLNAAPLMPLYDKDRPLDPMPEGYQPRWAFGKMLANPLDRSVVTWDWNDCDDIGRKVYAKTDAHVRRGGYRINFTWLRVELYLSDEKDFEGMDRALTMLRRLARPKLGGALEFPGGVVSE